MASLYERSNGTLYAQFFNAERSPTRKRISLKTKDKSTARALLSKFERLHRLGEADAWRDDLHAAVQPDCPESESTSIADAVEAFMQSRKEMNVTAKTLRTYRGTLRRMLEGSSTDRPLSALTAARVRSYIHAQDVATATQEKRYRTVRTFLRFHDIEELLGDVRRPKIEQKLPVACSPDELEAICEAVKDDYRRLRSKGQIPAGRLVWRVPAFQFAFLSGLRRKELALLRWRDVDTEARQMVLRKQKNRKQQRQPLSKKAARLLRRIGEGESQEFVFHGPYADAKERSAEAWASRLTRKFAEYRDAANARNELTLHTLRAGYITPTCESRVQRRSDKAACATRRYSDFAPLHRSDRRIISRGP